ncbi:hypothetical protein C0Q70_19301 [Pomacea canaliculata]|uniref:Poly [ADP-ribose] polymerase n=1 Tax=Pomacea canaliculata TaxID=400727 RepID=A0A2T7NJ06_POMCA|nr:hypothetical protein C0Q70_19301 [Pomacea canaliculata]
MPPRKRTSARGSAGDCPVSKKARSADVDIADGLVRWELEGDNRKWVELTSEQNKLLTGAWSKNKDEISIAVAPKMTMIFHMKKMVQKNKKTGFERRIRMAILDKADNDFYVWQWEDEKGQWNPYSAAVCLELEKAREDKQESIDFEACGRTYRVDLLKLEQVNISTNVIRKVARTKSDATVADAENVLSVSSSSTMIDSVKKEEEEEEEPVKTSKRRGKSGGKGKIEGKKKEEDGELQTKSVVRKVVVDKGSAPVDAECPLAEKCHVYKTAKVIWDCMLNQTNVGNNNNKYYIIQLLEENGKKAFHVWQRWGRVGYKGQTNIVNCSGDLDKAINVFSKKFQDKTGNSWNCKEKFVKHPGKYDLLHMDYSAKEDQVDAALVPDDEDENLKTPDSKLPEKVQDLIKLICDVKSMEEAVIEMKYDAKKAPLGKLTKEQIKAGYEALKEIETLINNKDFGSRLTEACSNFYTRIPHDFGQVKSPVVIKTPQAVKEKLQLLEALEDIEYAIKMLKTGDKSENPVDRHYHALTCGLCLLENTILIVAVEQLLPTVSELDLESVQCQMLLWHGSRLTNWAGILGQGLRIAPPEAPVTGYMFGKGVYFADMSSKSANYCFASKQKNIGLMLLCDVSLGSMNDKFAADYYADKLPKGKHSVRGCGSVGPDPSTYKNLPDGVVVPVGKGVNTGAKNPSGFTLNYNEYIVYDTRQICMRYLLKVQFDFK